MATFRRRFPPTNDIVRAFASCVFLVFSWSIVWFFQQMPGWVQFLNSWEVFGILSYTLAFALFESTLISLVVITIAIVLPRHWFRDRFAAQGSMMVLMLTFWTLLYQGIAFAFLVWSPSQLLLGFILPLASIVIACGLVHCSRRVEKAVRALAEHLTVFLYIYIPLGCLGLIVVLARNIP